MTISISEFQQEFRLQAELLISKPIEEVFHFFSEAQNLEKITPKFLNFKIVSPGPIEMGVDTLINYRIKLRGLPMCWTSVISAWEPPFRFVDEQIKGPYRYWIHEHRFESKGSETLVTDQVRYQVFGGRIIHNLFVKPDILKIFDFRTQELQKVFC